MVIPLCLGSCPLGKLYLREVDGNTTVFGELYLKLMVIPLCLGSCTLVKLMVIPLSDDRSVVEFAAVEFSCESWDSSLRTAHISMAWNNQLLL